MHVYALVAVSNVAHAPNAIAVVVANRLSTEKRKRNRRRQCCCMCARDALRPMMMMMMILTPTMYSYVAHAHLWVKFYHSSSDDSTHRRRESQRARRPTRRLQQHHRHHHKERDFPHQFDDDSDEHGHEGHRSLENVAERAHAIIERKIRIIQDKTYIRPLSSSGDTRMDEYGRRGSRWWTNMMCLARGCNNGTHDLQHLFDVLVLCCSQQYAAPCATARASSPCRILNRFALLFDEAGASVKSTRRIVRFIHMHVQKISALTCMRHGVC